MSKGSHNMSSPFLNARNVDPRNAALFAMFDKGSATIVGTAEGKLTSRENPIKGIISFLDAASAAAPAA
jgi:hypothetical protein